MYGGVKKYMDGQQDMSACGLIGQVCAHVCAHVLSCVLCCRVMYDGVKKCRHGQIS